jgi:hypothetical protein
MKKLLVLFLLAGCLGGSLFAFDIMSYPPPVSSGNVLVDAGVGLGFGNSGSLKIPPLGVSADYALPQVPISVGGGVAFWQYGKSSTIANVTTEETDSSLAIFGRGNWHWGINVSWLDLYTGFSLGYKMDWETERANSVSTTKSGGGFYPAFQVGAHFYFAKNIGAMIEFGLPMSRIGVAFKL